MKFSKIFNSIKEKTEKGHQQISEGTKPLPEPPLDFDANDFNQDMLGQSVGRFSYNPAILHKAHSVDYETAFQVLDTLKELPSYERRMAFWQENPTVFGYACIVVFDTHQKEYWPYYGRPYSALNSDMNKPEGRYEIASIFPGDIDQFCLFWDWCSKYYLSWLSTVVKKENSHWEEIKDVLSVDDYINGCLTQAKAEMENNNNLPTVHSQELFTDEQAKRYFFFFGSKRATWGKVDYVIDIPDLYTVLRGVITCPLSTYAEIISRYTFGYDFTVRIEFLRKQKERLVRGENVRVPQANKAQNQTVNGEPDNEPLSPQHQNFLDVVASIEASLGSIGQTINPTFYTPVTTLWERLGDEDIVKVRDVYRSEVKNQIDFAAESSDFLVNEYHSAVKMQPDRHRELLIEHRDKYVNLLAEKFGPIKRWYVELEGEASKTLERVAQVETAVFHFCHQNNKPFMVGRELVQILYRYRITIDRLNKVLLTERVTPENGILDNQAPDQKSNTDKVQSESKSKKGHLNKDIVTQHELSTDYSFVDAFINKARAPSTIKKLKRIYQDGNPSSFAYMLYALHDLGLIHNPSTASRTKLHNQLTSTFGSVGSRQNLTNNINKLNSPSQEESAEIQRQKKIIQKAK